MQAEKIKTFPSAGEKMASLSNVEGENYAIADSIKDLSKGIQKSLIQSAKINSKSNYEIAKSILASSNVVLNGIEHIADAIERKNKLDEYYILLREIASFEDQIIDMVKSKEELEDIYKQMQLSEFPIVELDEDAIALLATAFDEEKFKTLKSICFTNLISPINYIDKILGNEKNFEISITAKVSPEKVLRFTNLHVTNLKFNIIISPLNISIPAIDYIGLTTSEILDNNSDDEIQLVDVNSMANSNSHLVLYINGHKYYCKIRHWGTDENFRERKVHRCEESFTEGWRIIPNENFVRCKDWLYNWKKIQNCDDEDQVKKMIERYNNFQHVVYVPNISSEDVIWILNNIIKDAKINYTLEYEFKISEVKSFINDLNKEIALQNLRLLHQQLRIMVRKLKIESL